MDLNFSVFQEPRGVMRVLHLIFSISAFASVTEFGGSVTFNCKFDNKPSEYVYKYDYPFQLNLNDHELNPGNITECHPKVSIIGDFSSDARFFVATGVLALLFTLAIIFVYAKFDNMYKTNNQVPLIDFVITVIFAVLWLSSSAAWANGLSGLKHATDSNTIGWKGINDTCKKCPVSISAFSTLNISVVLGFLNFFLWAADLWFVYKETAWFQGNQGVITSGV
ncbi:hypothetical protein ILUMI_21824 [Ignelater luminosus]|uniref:MARVEL domain-containing protein n=1 Tax=Ignelater luminosus TaxID=2038154 RepID=A0A8K0CBD8_IGNLU|nr:hypothetical protein ILUMI_21824 [Ignelater luminosus]